MSCQIARDKFEVLSLKEVAEPSATLALYFQQPFEVGQVRKQNKVFINVFFLLLYGIIES